MAQSEWFVLSSMPHSTHISFTIVLSLYFPTGTDSYHGIVSFAGVSSFGQQYRTSLF